jgi:DNA-binding FrmR family transcriptional regulator
MKSHEVDEPILRNIQVAVSRSRCKSEDLDLRLRKIEGQIRGINKMVNQGEYCDDILIQVNAVQSALYSVGRMILENHVQTCLKDKPGEIDDQTIDELFVSIKRLHQIGN